MKGKKILFTAVMVIVLCASLITGATFALFTGGGKVDVAITAGTIQVEAYLKDEPKLSSEYGYNVSQTEVSYENSTNTVTVTDMVPGDIVEFTIQIFNKSSVDVKYQTVVNISRDNELGEALVVEIDGVPQSGTEVKGPWNKIAPSENPDEAVDEAKVKISLPATDNPQDVYQGKNVTISYAVVAIQGNYYTGPVAKIVELSDEQIADLEFNILSGDAAGGAINFPDVNGEAKIIAAYDFIATESVEQAEQGQYANWICDFVVSTDKDIPTGSLGFFGKYSPYAYGFTNPEGTLLKGNTLPMLSYAFMNALDAEVVVPYPAVCQIGTFTCGLFTHDGSKVGEEGGIEAGTTVSVSLVMANIAAVNEDLGELLEDTSKTSAQISEAVMNWIKENWRNEEKIIVVNTTTYSF